jgi:hypothetical protein
MKYVQPIYKTNYSLLRGGVPPLYRNNGVWCTQRMTVLRHLSDFDTTNGELLTE